jgi:hypothetical protein
MGGECDKLGDVNARARIGIVLLAVVASAMGGACGGSDEAASASGGGGSSAQRQHPDVLLEGDATDAALDALFAAEPEKAPKRFARIATPLEATVLDARPTFTWAVVPQGGAMRAPIAPPRGAPALLPLSPRRAPSFLAELVALVGPERAAFAAPAPFTGTAYLLAVNDAVGAPIVRVFTSEASYTPDDAAWALLREHTGKAITAWVMTADFEADRIAPEGGPFPGPWISFSVSPDAK